MYFQKVLSGKRVGLPEALCKKYGLKEGDIVIVEDINGHIIITPAEIVKRTRVH